MDRILAPKRNDSKFVVTFISFCHALLRLNLRQASISIICKLTLISLHDSHLCRSVLHHEFFSWANFLGCVTVYFLAYG